MDSNDNHDKKAVAANLSSNQTVTLEETPPTVRFFLKRLAVDLYIPKFFGDPKFNVSVVGIGLGSFVLIRDKIKHSWFRAVLCYKPEKTPILIDLHGASEQSVEAIKKAISAEESIIFYFSMDKTFSKEDFEKKATSLVNMAKQHYLAHLPKQKTISISFDISIIAGEMSFAEFLEKGNTEKAQGKKQTFQIISTSNELNALPESNTESNRVTTADSSQTAVTVTGSEPTKSPSLLNWGILIGGAAFLVTGLILLIFLQPYVGLFCIACGSGLAGWGGVKLLKKDTLTDNNDSDADSSWQPIETDRTAQNTSNPEQFKSPTPRNINGSNPNENELAMTTKKASEELHFS